LTYRVTQLLTGHGCFGNFLLRIGKADTALCPHCGLDEDSADHTTIVFGMWDERAILIGALGPDLTLSSVIGAITASKEAWLAFAKFAENVMRAKEDAERAKEATILCPDPFDSG